jgi:hypothetical protein
MKECKMDYKEFDAGDRDEYLKWIAEHPGCYVWSKRRAKLHSADCPSMQVKAKSKENLKTKSISPRACGKSRNAIAKHLPKALDRENDCQMCKPD